MGSQARYSIGVQLVQTTRACSLIENKARIFENFEMLRNRRSAYRQCVGKLVYGQRSGRKFLEDCHAGGVTQSIETGLKISVHIPLVATNRKRQLTVSYHEPIE